MIYLDNAATTFPKPDCVYDCVNEIQRTLAVNAGRGTYKSAQKASSIIDEVRQKISAFTGCSSTNQIVLSPSATIAMNQIIGGLNWNENMNVYVSPFEHNAVARPLKSMADKYGFSVILLPFDGKSQKLDSDKMNNMFAVKHPDVVFVNHISNVTGLILPVEEIFRPAKRYNAVTVLDASQSLGLLDVNVRDMQADFIAFAGHKNLYGHFGIGGFISSGRVPLKKYLAGGTGSDSLNLDMPSGMPVGFEPASHNIIAAAALNSSLDWLNSIGIVNVFSHKKDLTLYAVENLKKFRNIDVYLPGNADEHISVISINHKEYRPDELAEILNEDFDIAVRSGYHCAPFVHELIGTKDSFGTVRISIGYFNTKTDIDKLIAALEELK